MNPAMMQGIYQVDGLGEYSLATSQHVHSADGRRDAQDARAGLDRLGVLDTAASLHGAHRAHAPAATLLPPTATSSTASPTPCPSRMERRKRPCWAAGTLVDTHLRRRAAAAPGTRPRHPRAYGAPGANRRNDYNAICCMPTASPGSTRRASTTCRFFHNDNVHADAVSKKSLKVLDAKLFADAGEHADFHLKHQLRVGGADRPVRPRARFTVSRASAGAGLFLDHRHPSRWRRPLKAAGERGAHRLGQGAAARRGAIIPASTNFRRPSPTASPMTGGGRAGARYLYICEFGLVHYCSQQARIPRSAAGPVRQGGSAARVPHPGRVENAPNCTISACIRSATVDHWRARASQDLAGHSRRSARRQFGDRAGPGADSLILRNNLWVSRQLKELVFSYLFLRLSEIS